VNKKILLSVLNIALVAMLVGVGVYALYSSTVTSTGNTFSTSQLVLKADGSDTMVPLNVSGIAPGDDGATYYSQFYELTKQGSVPAGKLSFKIDNVHETAGADTHTDLGNNVLVSVYFPDPETFVGDFTVAQLQSGVTVTDDFDHAVPSSGNLGIQLSPNLPSSVGNEVQGDGLTFDGHLSLEQTITAH
jgi:predicted ribosomally synthesized peptide with SipW-like signal peptide